MNISVHVTENQTIHVRITDDEQKPIARFELDHFDTMQLAKKLWHEAMDLELAERWKGVDA